jgi:hypothetical protein
MFLGSPNGSFKITALPKPAAVHYSGYNLARYLAIGSSAELPKTFVFDHLNFDSATTTLTPESRTTVNDLIVVLKACPTAQVQLAGHTDSTGDSTSNQTWTPPRDYANWFSWASFRVKQKRSLWEALE